MYNFLLKALLFSAIILLILDGTKRVHDLTSDTVKSYSYIIDSASDTELLVMGSSHAYWGVNPAFFSMKTLNLAYNNRPFHQDLEILEKYIDKLPHLKAVILPADYFTLYFNGSENYNNLNSVHFRLKNTSFFDYYRHIKWCKFDCSKYPDEIELQGYALHKDSLSVLSYEEKVEQGAKRVFDWNNEWLDNQSYSATIHANINRLDAILPRLKERDIQVLFVKYPVSKFVESGYIDSISDGGLFQYASDRNLTVVNCSEYNFIEAEFNDIDHLNSLGAEKLSRILDSILMAKTTY